MPEDEFVTFQIFSDQVAALDLGAALDDAGIEFQVENSSSNLVPFYTSSQLANEFRVKIRKSDFEKADQLLEQISLSQIESVDEDYFLFKFTDEELMEIIAKKDEWGQFNFLLSQKLLKERGKEVRPAQIESFKEQRIEELTRPEENQKGFVNAGYIFALLGGIIGFFIGWHLATHKRTLPNGEQIYSYTLEDRKHGNSIVILGLFCTVIWLIIWFGTF